MEAAGPYYAFEQLPLGPDKPLKKAEGGGGRRPRSRWWWCCGSRKHESRFIRLNAKRLTLARFPHNRVVNTKYTVVSFVPKVLYEQFKYFFNLYFLLVALSHQRPIMWAGRGSRVCLGGHCKIVIVCHMPAQTESCHRHLYE